MARRIRYNALKVFSSKVIGSSLDAPVLPMLHINKRRDFSLLRKNPIASHANDDPSLQNKTEQPTEVEQPSLDNTILDTSKELMDVEPLGSNELESELSQKIEYLQKIPVEIKPSYAPYNLAIASPYAVMQDQATAPAVAEYLANTITRFCNDNDAQGSDDWRVSIGLRDDILKSTTLHMTLSRDSLILRFEIHDAEANTLISNGIDTLKSLLDQSLKSRREVFITLN